jgi:uncharacterized protein (TIGR03067 family)
MADDKKDNKPDVKTELAAIKGKWKVVSTKFNGKGITSGADRVLIFDDKEFTAYQGDTKLRSLTFKLDPTSSPKRIDLARAGSNDTITGIYSLKGNKLTICYPEPGAERPKKLESKDGGKVFLMVLERIKP